MYVIVDLIIFVFVLTCQVFIRLFIIVMLLEGVRDIHRRLTGREYSHRPPSGVQQVGGSGKIEQVKVGRGIFRHNKVVIALGIE
jgi:hypothetical protein